MPMSDRARAVRLFFEERVASHREVFEAFATDEDLGFLRKPAERVGIPAPVLEACDFYDDNWLERDNGTVHVFRVVVAGQPTYGVRVNSDGSGGFLEVFDGDGTDLGAARTEWDFVLWMPRAEVRRATEEGIRLPALDAANARYLQQINTRHPHPSARLPANPAPPGG